MADNSILIHNHLLNVTGIMPFENNRLWNIPVKILNLIVENITFKP
jgi:hypothetical protein